MSVCQFENERRFVRYYKLEGLRVYPWELGYDYDDENDPWSLMLEEYEEARKVELARFPFHVTVGWQFGNVSTSGATVEDMTAWLEEEVERGQYDFDVMDNHRASRFYFLDEETTFRFKLFWGGL